ncbi:MAG: tRNA epoxyqueuosine(34) reductase QueG [Lachnospiraceae bacterium]|nr:tRNA epoxyqueuosine(34) reductase QueG [Lachnospiraceae bacterium]
MVDLYRLAEELNIHDIAVCSAEPFRDVEHILHKDVTLDIFPPFTETDIHKRVEPKETMKDAASFLVILEHYEPEIYKKRDGRYGNISPAASGEDYHRVVRRKLNSLVDALKTEYPNGDYMAFVDNSPFSEKHIAVRSGLGRILKNGLFYSKTFGSRCFIGIVLTNLPVEIWNLERRKDGQDRWFDRCLSCNACIQLCPGNALNYDGMNSYRCVSYLTQKKEELTDDEKTKMGAHIYGCDVCQKVCPLNKKIPEGYETGSEISLDELMTMTNKGFKLKYQKTAAGWRGKKQLQKNAEIALKNMER